MNDNQAANGSLSVNDSLSVNGSRPASADLPPSPGQTVGPFFGFALPYPGGELLVPPHHPDAVRLHGYVLDGAGDPVPDALLEIWQADREGRPGRRPGSLHRDGHTFTGWGRAATDGVGHYQFTTLEPVRDATPTRAGAAPDGHAAPDGNAAPDADTAPDANAAPDQAPRAPFIALTVFARGLMHRLLTRIYLPGSGTGSGTPTDDPFLLSVPADRRATLIAERDDVRSLRFDVHLQGDQETVFLSFTRR